jgi:hypothetical protein
MIMENVTDARIKILEEEVRQLQDDLQAERVKCARLESELDDLAFDNERMRGLLTAAGIEKLRVDPAVSDVMIETTEIPSESDGFELLEDGDSNFPQNPLTKIENACGGMNVICALFLDTNLPFYSTQGELIVCGGVDKTLRIYDVPCREREHAKGNISILVIAITLSAPILAIDVCGGLIACSLMDGGHAVVSCILHTTSFLFIHASCLVIRC